MIKIIGGFQSVTKKKSKQSETTKKKEENGTAGQKVSVSKDKPAKKPKKITKKQLENALKDAQEHMEKYKTQLTYLQAEYENYVKSMERRETRLRLQANRELILSLLPVLDDLERAQILVPRIKPNEPFIGGLKMVVDNLKNALKDAGVNAIECEGKAFDPLRHEAVVREETSKVPPNTVIEELRKGYLLKGELLRPTMVKIAINPTSTNEVEDPQDNTTDVK
jgi:molecular chaperone GrpE